MSTAKNDDAVYSALALARERDLNSEYDWIARRVDADRAVSRNVKVLVRETGLTEGKVRGALKRLVAAERIQQVNVRWGGRQTTTWATLEEIGLEIKAKRAEKIAELIEDHGSANAYGEKILAKIERVREMLDELEMRVNVRGSTDSNVLALDLIDDAVPMKRYGAENVEELREEMGDPLKQR